MNRDSLVSIQESAALKGVLIILIMLGHNIAFTTWLVEYQAMGFLYTFHIHCFFLLPFLYSIRDINLTRILNSFIRIYIPYLVVYLTLTAGYFGLYSDQSGSLVEYALSLFNGNPHVLKKYAGVQFLWFLPAMFVMILLIDFYYSASVLLKLFLFAFSFLLSALFSPADWLAISSREDNIAYFIPNIITALKYLWMGVTLRAIISDGRLVKSIFLWCFLFGLGTLAYFRCFSSLVSTSNYCQELPFNLSIVLVIVMPFSFLVAFIFFKRNFTLPGILINYGNHSMQIYLISAFVGYSLWYAIEHLGNINFLVVLVAQILVMNISYYFSFYISKSRTWCLIFPKSYLDFRLHLAALVRLN